MGWALIVVGILLIGFCIYVWMFAYEKSQSDDPQDRLVQVQKDKYDPNMTRFAARKEKKASSARTEAATQIGGEARAVTDMIRQQREALEAQADLDEQPGRSERVTEKEVIEHKVQMNLLNLALSNNTDVTNLLEEDRKRRLNAADLDNKLAEMRERVKLALISKQLSELQKVALVQEFIDRIVRDIDAIEADNTISDKAKQRMIEDREDIIGTLKEERRGRQRGLLEAYRGGDVRADDDDPVV